MARRILAIGLDGYETRIGNRLMSEGRLPALSALAARSARFLLDHVDSSGSGLAWEHFATGLSPERAGRWNAVSFDPATYTAWQEDTSLTPFAAHLAARTVVLDASYFALSLAANVRGAVAWGAYDPGVGAFSRPAGLLEEMKRRFGSQDERIILNLAPWSSIEHTRLFGEKAVSFIDMRRRAALWLFGERLPDWDLGFLVASELHAATEALWYGVDRNHPLHRRVPSTAAAGQALLAIYGAVDRLVKDLVAAFPDAAIVAFAMNGMGANHSDTASMALLPELLYRHAMGKPLMRFDGGPGEAAQLPMLAPDDGWGRHLRELLPGAVTPPGSAGHGLQSLEWMPAARYGSHWPHMPAFALPSYYDGRVRINLAGREARGTVPVARYEAVCTEIEELLRDCRDSITGQPVIAKIVRAVGADPLLLNRTQADLTVAWNGMVLGLDHPRLGRIGPLPVRRPGGHTGPHGIAWISGAGIPAGDFGVRSSFDVAPTIVEMLGEAPVPGMSGESFLGALQTVAAESG